jgi:hypothetical protein
MLRDDILRNAKARDEAVFLVDGRNEDTQNHRATAAKSGRRGTTHHLGIDAQIPLSSLDISPSWSQTLPIVGGGVK